MTDLGQLPPVTTTTDAIQLTGGADGFRAALRQWLLDELTDEVRKAGSGGPDGGHLESPP